MNLAIYSPRQNSVTETFIQAHRDIPGAKVKFYFGGIQKAMLEGKGTLIDLSFRSRFHKIVYNPLKKLKLNPAQEAIASSFLEEKIDVILAEYGMMGGKILPIAKALNIPMVVHFHGFDASRYDVLQEEKDTYIEMFKYAHAVIAVSERMKDMLIEIGCPPEKVVRNTYGVHPRFLDLSPTYEKKQLVGLGRFVDKKAPYYTIMAFQKALEVHPDARLIIGGDGPLYDVCVNLVKKWRIDDRVSLPGILKPEDFREILTQSRAFVQHSIRPTSGDMEGTPLSVLEAQASALPVIATRHAGIPDVVLEEKTGLLCDEHDIDQMATNMIRVLDSSEYSRELGEAGRKRYILNFSIERHLNSLADTLKDAIASKRA